MSPRIFGIRVDERFLDHRRRSTSFAAIAGAVVALVCFEYELIHRHRVAWEPLSILLAMLTVKMAAMLWFRLTD
jgi:hypothetical protein